MYTRQVKWIVLIHAVKYSVLMLSAKFDLNLLILCKVIAKMSSGLLFVDTVFPV